jgi:hypothetical protein
VTHAILDGRVVCREPETALCRADWQCDCESFYGLEQDAEGWSHDAVDWLTDRDVRHMSVGAVTPDNCNICNWLNADVLTDTFRDYDYLFYNDDLPNGDITVSWEGEYYEWEYTDPRVTGRMIGRSIVAAWAEDLGLDEPGPGLPTLVESLQKVGEAARRMAALIGGKTS